MRRREAYLWVVFGVAGVEGDGFEVEATVEVDGGDNVSVRGWNRTSRSECQHPTYRIKYETDDVR